MTHASQADLVARFGAAEILNLTDRDNTGQIDAAVVSRALQDADALIAGHVAGRAGRPAPALLNRIACDLARWYLYDESPTEAVRQGYDDSLRLLQAIAAGRIGAATGSGGVWVHSRKRRA